MTTVRELVTVLRYRVNQSGLREYRQAGIKAAQELRKTIDAAQTGSQPLGGLRAALHKVAQEASVVRRRVQEVTSATRQAANASVMGSGGRGGVMRQAIVGGSQGLALGIGDAVRETRTFVNAQAAALRQSKEMRHHYSAIGGYIRAAIAGLGIAGFTGAVDQAMGAEAQIDLYAQNPGNKKQIRDQIYRNAQGAGSDYVAGLDMFGSIARNRSTLGLSDEQAIKLADLTSKSVALTSKGSAQDSAAILQFSQALGSGVLQGDELRSILENSGGLANAIADCFGVSVTQLKKMGAEGKLTSKEMAQGLLKQADKIQEKFDKMPKGFGKGMTLLRNGWVKMSRDINEATGASERFFEVSKLVAENMASIAKYVAIIAGAWGIRRVNRALTAMRTITDEINGKTVKTIMNWRQFAWATARNALPLLKIAAALGAIYLIGEDISVWMKGGKSLIGTWIGPASEWKTQIDAVTGFFKDVKEFITGNADDVGAWVTKWGTVATVIGGLYVLLSPFGGLVKHIGKVLIPAMWWAVKRHPLTAIITLLITIAGKWDDIIKKISDAGKRIAEVFGVDGESFRNPDPNNPNENFGNRNKRKREQILSRMANQKTKDAFAPIVNQWFNNDVKVTTTPERTGDAVRGATSGLGAASKEARGQLGGVEPRP